MISLVIPAHNEERRLAKTVEYYAGFFKEFDIIIVPNGCTDKTESIADALADKFSNVRVISTPKAGKGLAIRLGFANAKMAVVGFVDADLAIVPKEFSKLLPFIKEYDCVIASRKIKGSVVTVLEPWRVRFASRVHNWIIRILFGLSIKDTQCGAKIYRKDAIGAVLASCYIDKMAFDVEFLWRIKKLGKTIKEVPIVWVHNAIDSKTGIFKTGIKMFIDLFRLRWNG